MSWPTTDTYNPAEENALIEYLGDLSAAELAANDFWPGDYDDLSCALMDAGWRVTWHADYWFAAQRPDGGAWVEYIEGDLYKRESLEACQLYADIMSQKFPPPITIYQNGKHPEIINR